MNPYANSLDPEEMPRNFGSLQGPNCQHSGIIMAMTNAERQRKFRANRDSNPEKRAAYLQKQKQVYKGKKASGQRKSVKDMTEREKRSARKKWRKEKKEQRARENEIKKIITPPESPMSLNEDERPMSSRQKLHSQKKKNKERSKCYRDNKNLKHRLYMEGKKVERYKKRYQRLLSAQKSDALNDTPRTRTRKLLKHFPKKEIRKTLIFHNALLDQVRLSYAKAKKRSEKNHVQKILSGSILRKYKTKSIALTLCGVHGNLNRGRNKRTCLSRRVFKCVRDFFERDDVSRIAPGVKNTVTSGKVKKQRRILNDTIKHLHTKFLSEVTFEISRTTFSRLKPFWVRCPTERDRNTCLCKTCENISFMASALKKTGVIATNNMDDIVEMVTCDQGKKECMYNECSTCKNSEMAINQEHLNNRAEWYEWTTTKEKRMIKVGQKSQEKEISYTQKVSKVGSASELTTQFNSIIPQFKKHSFNIKHQFNYFRNRRDELQDNECIVHVDFSENYVCKLASEIQSMHFGASKRQITLHTGIYHTNQKRQTFCTVSNSLHHGPAAVWAHMKPILNKIRCENPEITKVEIFSDGPTTQYRQKANFYLFSNELLPLGFEEASWNFFEAGHGKGVPDAVGGAIKRTADRMVRYGCDITSAQDFVHAVNKEGSATDVFEIEESSINLHQDMLDRVQLKAVVGTMKLHQIVSHSSGVILYRDVSCTCRLSTECQGHALSTGTLESKSKGNAEKSIFDSSVKRETWKKQPKKSKQAPTRTTKTFKSLLNELKSCRAFDTLKVKCEEISECLPDLNCNPQAINITDHHLEVDIDAMDLSPDDIPDNRVLYPCEANSDGNCLPSCGSIYAYGSPDRTAEIRVRVVVELVLHEETYLDNAFLHQGMQTSDTKAKDLPKTYAQYSDLFTPGMVLNDITIPTVYRMEAVTVRSDKTYMGIWQMHALASVLNVPIYSLYPRLGNPNVRADLNRILMPRNASVHQQPVYILWTSTRSDMVKEHWVPNHFVPVVPVSLSDSNSHLTADACDTQTDEDIIIVTFTDDNNENNDKEEYTIDICTAATTEADMKTDDSDNQTDHPVTETDMPTGDDCHRQTDHPVTETETDMMTGDCHRQTDHPVTETETDMMPGDCQRQTDHPVTETETDMPTGDDCHRQTDHPVTETETDMMTGDCHRQTDHPVTETETDMPTGDDCHRQTDHPETETDMPTGDDCHRQTDHPVTETETEMSTDDCHRQTDCERIKVGSYVIVSYDNRPYPGYVEKLEEGEMFVECMRKARGDRFYWPIYGKDKCWYEHNQILTLIPEPEMIGSGPYYRIEASVWSTVNGRLNMK